jgi:hypothetical protein
MKIPRKVGITRIVPKMYHGVRFPILVSVLSLKNPTVGVVSASAICPDSMTDADTNGLNLTTSLT